MSISEFDVVMRLSLACLLGGLIGLERESVDRPAGFRTHILVCAGSALIMMVSMFAFSGFEAPRDPGRIAAQVVSGIGFLGAGTIIREGVSVKGLTTAASLWVVSGIGLAVGGGMFFPAVVTTCMVFLTLVLFGRIEHKFMLNKCQHQLRVQVRDQPGQIGAIGMFFGKHGISIANLTMSHLSEKQYLEIDFCLRVPSAVDLIKIIDELAMMEGITSVEKL